MKFIPRLPRFFIRGYREIKRPSFPVNDKHLEIRGRVNDVKPVIGVKQRKSA